MSVDMFLKIDRNQGRIEGQQARRRDRRPRLVVEPQPVRRRPRRRRQRRRQGERAGHARHEVARQVVVRPRLRLRLRQAHPEGRAVRPQGRREPARVSEGHDGRHPRDLGLDRRLGGEDKITKSVSLNFAKVKVEYQEQQKDGSGKPAGNVGWDIASNSKY